MSGFIGIISSQPQETNTALLDLPALVIASCCDDYTGAWNSHQVDLRFGWLKTSEDTTEEQLPFCVDENLRIVGDVRLDNRIALVTELSAYFEAISSTTPDSYLLLYAYKHWGEDCLHHIAGDYAFAIWNEQTGYLFCARDHFGLIPFYYAPYENRFLFTNFYRALKDIPCLMSELSDDVLKDYLRSGQNQHFDQTIYKKIKKLPPAHKLIYAGGETYISRYWEIPSHIAPIRYKTTKEYVSHFYNLFEQSIKDRTRSNKVASSLSGGMDSSSITAIAKKVLDENYGDNHTLVSFNIAYTQLISENEGYFAMLISRHLNIPIEQYIAEDYVKNVAQPLTTWIPEPAGAPIATAESQILSDTTTFSRIYLTGFGGDPLFEFEPLTHRRLSRQGYWLQPFLDNLIFYKTFGHLIRTIGQQIRKLIKKVTIKNDKLPFWFNSSSFPDQHSPIKPNKDTPSMRSNFAMTGNPYWSWLFETSHPGFTGKKVKVRQPFFTLDLYLFILALPPHVLYQKSLLRMSMIPYLPGEVIRRPKTLLFGNPLSQNLKKQEVQDRMEKIIVQSGDFLTGKMDVPTLLGAIRDPIYSDMSYTYFLPVLHVLSWKNYTFNNFTNLK